MHVGSQILLKCLLALADSDLQIRGGGGQKSRARGKEGAWPFGPQFGLKIRGGAGQTPQAPPLDLPLVRSYHWVNKKYLYSYIIKDI